MPRRNNNTVEGRIEFEVGNMLMKKSKPTGNAAHIIVPKSTIGKTLIVIVPKRQADLKLIQSNKPERMGFSVDPEICCNKCGNPLFRPAWDKKKELELCKCKH